MFTAIIEGGVGWALGRVGDTAAGAFMRMWNERKAKVELIDIIVEAMDAAISVAPNLEEDFRSETFVHHVVAPVVVHFLRDLNTDKPEAEIAQSYIERFVEPFLRGRTTDETLSQLFRTQRRDLEQGISFFLTRLRPALYASKHWREPIHDQALEEVRSTVLRIERRLTPVTVADSVDIDQARVDATVASQALQSWQQTISGEHIDRPELEVLQQRIREHPYGSTLIIGESGSGKSALFAELVGRLQAQGVVVFAIKADLLPTHVKTLSDVSEALGLRGHLISEIEALARTAPVVVLIDQLDAVSEVMDRSSERMRLLLQVAHHFQDKKRAERVAPPVHILVSSRPFEADYDARFQSLSAEVVQLALPSLEQIHELMKRLHVSVEEIPEALNETLRRPFALRIFIDILRRGVPGRELIASQLLNTWLTSADLGDSAMRREVLKFLEKLAADMTESESLWRPADVYEIQDPQAVQVAVASGIVVRQNGLVGFSHQAWLDDFQAKNFSTGHSLANYAWQRQDGLFARATVLRALQRLRAFDLPAYEQAIDALLGKAGTRRHLRHLVVDMVAGQQQPSARERGWLQHLVRSDVPLARRALARITAHWTDWREYLLPLVPSIMGNAELRWSVVQLLIAEAPFDADFVIRSIAVHWDAPERDLEALEVFSKSGQWSTAIVERLRLVFARQQLDDYMIVSYAERLGDDRAANLIQIYLDHVEVSNEERLRFYGLGKLAHRSALAFANALFSWFVHVASRDTPRSRGLLDAYPSSSSLPHWWDYEHTEDGIFGITKSVLLACAKEHPHDFLSLIEMFTDVEVAEVQALIAEGFAAGNTALANESVEYLLGDSRRLQVGMAFLQAADGVSHLVNGWSTQVLLRAIVSQLGAQQLERLRAGIESWDPYLHRAWEESDVSTRRERRIWAEEKRFPLLALLPAHVLTPRRYRQIQEWRATQPEIRGSRGRTMMSEVESPMSPQQMANATDDDVFRMIDEVADDTDRRRGRRGLRRDGGTRQLAHAFAAFGRSHSDRALRIAEQRFRPGRHENAAGELLRVLAEDANVNAQRVRALVWKWHREGFITEGWRRDVAWALKDLANRDEGLIDEDVVLLESWIVNDPQRTNERTIARLGLEERNRAANSHHKVEAAPIVFRRGLGGMRVPPQDNFTLLAAMAAGLLERAEPDWDGWLSALERHADRSEDPAIWTAVLIFRGAPLFWADRPRATRLIQTIWDRFPDAFSDKYVADFLWRNRDLVASETMKAVRDCWLAGDAVGNRQTAGELLMATVLLDPRDKTASEQLEQILASPETPERLGALFTASAAWHEDSPALRPGAHSVLMRFARQANGHEALAIAGAVSHQAPPAADAFSKELLTTITSNPAVLRVCLNRSFTRDLQELLLSPGFEELVLEVAERCTELMFAKGESRVRMPYGESFVSIAIAIQRSMDPLRSRAMDLYERLLDGSAYGAEEAATASLSRV
ncbi:MAG: ATP-binding protein [Hydrogenophaga sp.]|uniref:NACHT domain-containing protein n=1 Tax=Hydrogenophaga sp. TaxID=1904254 RepID=UPI00273328DF|nr:ATP-binding protein [Hydrogenophaga sp.]MDP3345328.1 ATP-binding protein [Hydrogenophaga sp.]MDP3806129.1 ATP-binding protein [Hydrogenophaga sp.]MDP3925523.1 ATP-binding protein [Hydrogenophaga sp.]